MSTFLNFPKDFIWGAATASYQIEGAVLEDGRSESIWDRFSHTPGKIRNGVTGDIACDHYHRMEGDVALMRKLGLRAYRFSVSWSRVMPQGRGKPNQKGLDFYSRLVDILQKNSIIPFVTLYHWDLPLSLQDGGGWLNRRTSDWFTEFAECMYYTLGDRVTFWTTLNEPNVFAKLGYLDGKHAPGFSDNETFLQVAHHLLLSHGKAVQAGRAILSNAKFGIVPAISMNYCTDGDEQVLKSIWDHGPGHFLDPVFFGKYPHGSQHNLYPIMCDGDMQTISVPLDFLGINHYFSLWFSKDKKGKIKREKRELPTTDRGWIVYPDGFRDMLLKVKKLYGDIPIYVMENGASYPDKISPDGKVHDQDRVNYYRIYIQSLHNAIQQGVDVRGYFAWSLMDNFEWEEGYSSRFGIVYVDFETQNRIVKDSGNFYSKVIAENGLESEI